MARPVVLVALVVFGCGRDGESSGVVAKTNPPSGPDCAKAVAKGSLKWIEDDYPAAVACAKVMNAPIVLDLWAHWCHTCMSMQSTVLMDPSFAAVADKFVFVSIDSESERNTAVVNKFASTPLPTFYVLDPQERVLARLAGGATLKEFQELLAVGKRAQGGGMAVADARLLGAERALSVRNFDVADQELEAAIAAAPPSWPRRAQALGSLILAKDKLDDQDGCAELADKYMDQVGSSPVSIAFYWTALNCAAKTSKENPERSKRIRDRAIVNYTAMVNDPASVLTSDDVGEALGYLREALNDAGRKEEARQIAERLRELLDVAWQKAPTPAARMTHMWPRAEAYAYLGRPLDLVPDLEKLAAELPQEYDPPSRIGWLYLQGGKLAEAAAWTDKSLAMAYGQRKGRVLSQRADIAQAAGDRLLERRYRAEAVLLFETLPDGQQAPDLLLKARQALEEADKAARDADPSLHAAGSGDATGSGSPAVGSGSAAAGSGSAVGSGSSVGVQRSDKRTPVGTGRRK